MKRPIEPAACDFTVTDSWWPTGGVQMHVLPFHQRRCSDFYAAHLEYEARQRGVGASAPAPRVEPPVLLGFRSAWSDPDPAYDYQISWSPDDHALLNSGFERDYVNTYGAGDPEALWRYRRLK